MCNEAAVISTFARSTPQGYGTLSNMYNPSIRSHGYLGITSFRTKVLYVPQRPSLLPGSPTDFLETITSLGSHKVEGSSFQHVLNRAFQIGEQWGIDNELWARAWSNLSGGESQRVLLASAVALDTAEILLLDGKPSRQFLITNESTLPEPTSALDPETASWVETYLVERIRQGDTSLKALIWITHSSEQGRRIGTRFIHMTAGGCYESDDPAPTPNTPSTPHGSRSEASSIRLTAP